MKEDMTFVGWGVVGEPLSGVIVAGPDGPSIDVTGYYDGDYWTDEDFLGPDGWGIVPVYETPDGRQYPPEARLYPYLA